MVSYTYGKTLLKIENVSLEYDGRPILNTDLMWAALVAGAHVRARSLIFSSVQYSYELIIAQ